MSSEVTLSYSHGASAMTLLGGTIGENLGRVAAAHPDAEVLVDVPTGRRWTYSVFDAGTDILARGLIAAGLRAGDRVGIWAPNCAEWVQLQYATAKAGIILVNINPAYRSHELAFALRQSGVRVLVSAEQFKTSDYRAMIEEVRPDLPDLEDVIYVGTPAWHALFESGQAAAGDDPLREREASLSSDDPINIQYTSGTTGFPKGATLSHHNILNNAFFIGEGCGYSPQDRVCIPVPFYHCFDHGRIAVPGRGHEAGRQRDEHDRGDDLLRDDRDVAGLDADDRRRRHGSPGLDRRAGTPARGSQDRRPGNRPGAAQGHPGRTVHARLLGDAGLLERTGQDRRGDRLGALDAHRRPGGHGRGGYLNIVGRIKDMVIRGGENIYPREVEEFLYAHPAIEDVQVIGVPDVKYGEELCAWIRLRPGQDLSQDDVREYCRGKIAHYKIPRYVRFGTDFPMTITGKVQKFKMRETSITELSLEEASNTRTA